MSVATDVPARAPEAPESSARRRRGRWIEHWNPEDPAFWEARGRRIARRNLVWSIFAEHVGFSIWVLWTIVVINLANIGSRCRSPSCSC